MEATIEGITQPLLQALSPAHRTSITPFVIGETLRIKRIQNLPGDTVGNIKLYVLKPATATDPKQWMLNPAGIDNAISGIFPEPIHIGAMENAEEDVSKSKTTSTIGKLLAEVIGPIETTYGAQVQTALNQLRGLLDADGQTRAAELTQFDTEVNSKIGAFFPDINIKLHVPTPELKEVFTKGTIKVYEQHFNGGKDVSTLGHGAQRSIQMALIRHLSELKKAAQVHTTTTLLLIDEPELYLHPQAIEIVREALKLLSTQGYQVIFSTHSPMMITSDDVGSTILVRKIAQKGTHRRVTLKVAVPQVILDSPSQVELLFSLSNSSNILFSEAVILTEGQTEHKVFPSVIEKVTNKSLGIHKCALVKQNGVTNTKKSMNVLNAMDLPTKAIVDLDYVFKYAISDGFLQATDTDISACKTHLALISATKNINIGTDGWPARSPGTVSAAEAFVILANEPTIQANIDNLHEKLKAHKIWFWKKGAIEQHLGIAGKTEQHWANYVAALKNQTFQTLAPDHVGVTDCITWLTV